MIYCKMAYTTYKINLVCKWYLIKSDKRKIQGTKKKKYLVNSLWDYK